MEAPNQNSLQVTIRRLKEIVAGMQGEDNESCKLIGQMEQLATEIEKKSNGNGNTPFLNPNIVTPIIS